MAKSKLRIGIVGTGGMANQHAEQFAKQKGVTLASCFDIVPGRAAEFAQRHTVARVASNLTDLLTDVDAVAIVTPDRFHHEGALAVLKAGKHLLCEKPLTVTLAEAKAVAKLAKRASRAGQVGMVNFSYRRSAALACAFSAASYASPGGCPAAWRRRSSASQSSCSASGMS